MAEGFPHIPERRDKVQPVLVVDRAVLGEEDNSLDKEWVDSRPDRDREYKERGDRTSAVDKEHIPPVLLEEVFRESLWLVVEPKVAFSQEVFSS